MHDILVAIVLGIVEGLTEFLPISSTGHLILAGHVLGFAGEKASTFEVFIQLGAILAVVWLYWRRFAALFDFRNGSGLSGSRGLIALAVTTLPALVIGFAAHKAIKEHLFNNFTVALGLGLGGIALILIERWLKDRQGVRLEALNLRQALIIGFCQVLAMWPGVSRSGATIVGGMAQGLDRRAAVEYSFLAAVPVMIAATGYDLMKSLHTLHAADAPMFAVGFVTSFLMAIGAIKLFVRYVQTTDLKPFGWYRIALALVILAILNLTNWLVPEGRPAAGPTRTSRQTEPASQESSLRQMLPHADGYIKRRLNLSFVAAVKPLPIARIDRKWSCPDPARPSW
jgi:undecaprenyl-diphosphatase